MRTRPPVRQAPPDPILLAARDQRRHLGAAGVLGGVLVLGLVAVLVVLNLPGGSGEPVVPGPPTTVGVPARSLAGAPLLTGFYSAGLKPSECYGSCRPGDPGAEAEAHDRARIAQLAGLHVRFVIHNSSPADWYAASPRSFLAFLGDLHEHEIGVSYGLASGRTDWFGAPGSTAGFTTGLAEAQFRRTDLDHDGVSDLDGRIDALYQAHEVLEWATHDQRVAMYQVAKKWFPQTPVVVYYAGLLTRTVDPALRGKPHRRGGRWADYAFGPGEADIVHVSADKPFDDAGRFDPARSAADLRASVRIVHRATPKVPIWVHSSFAADRDMRAHPASMWTPAELEGWYRAVVTVPGVRGVFLRSFGRFAYDLANPRFALQRELWRRIGADAAAGRMP
jgi:hypothetical protein